jgi:hypothetical protein
MMKWTWILLQAALFALPLLGSDPCDHSMGISFVAGHDERGYFVRAVREDYPPGRGVEKGAIYSGVAEYLAQGAGANAYFVNETTGFAVAMKEWRAADPLSTLRAFGKDAGIEVVTTPDNWWVMGRPDYQKAAETTISIHPADPAQRSRLNEKDTAQLESALIRELPVRNSWSRYGSVSQDLSYHWLGDDANTSTVILVSELKGESSPSAKYAWKVRVSRIAERYNVECMWKKNEIWGALVPEINQDFDGDGVRDPVFRGGPCGPGGRQTCDGVIISGADGQSLFEFGAGELAVEKAASGPPRFAVDVSSAVDEGKYVSEVNRTGMVPGKGPFVVSFDSVGKACQVNGLVESAEIERAATSRPASDRVRARDLLASVVGGPEKVRVYLFGQRAHDASSKSQEILLEERHWSLTPPSSFSDFHPPYYQSRLAFRYKAPKQEKEKKPE